MARMTIKAYMIGNHVASFQSEGIARRFAIQYTCAYKGTVELVHKTDMIGQYEGGTSSGEFMLHHNEFLKGGYQL